MVQLVSASVRFEVPRVFRLTAPAEKPYGREVGMELLVGESEGSPTWLSLDDAEELASALQHSIARLRREQAADR
jgi:hypothetical protein